MYLEKERNLLLLTMISVLFCESFINSEVHAQHLRKIVDDCMPMAYNNKTTSQKL